MLALLVGYPTDDAGRYLIPLSVKAKHSPERVAQAEACARAKGIRWRYVDRR